MSFGSVLKFASRAAWLLLAGQALASPSTSFALEFYTAGHADLFVSSDANGTSLNLFYDFGEGAVIDGTALTERWKYGPPSEIVTVVPESAQISGSTRLPEYWNGRTMWNLPSNSTSGIPYLGTGKDEDYFFGQGIFVDDAVTLYFDSFVSRPGGGEFILYNLPLIGNANVYMNTQDGITTDDKIAVGLHGHNNWGFSEIGQYQIRFRAEAVRASDSQLVNGFAVYTFNVVVPEPSTYALAGVAVVILGVVVRKKSARPKPASA